MEKPIFYVTADLERALGFEELVSNWHIVCVRTSSFVTLIRERGGTVFCLNEHEPQTELTATSELLNHPAVHEYIRKHDPQPQIMVFKIDPAIERAVQKLNGTLMNTSFTLNQQFELKTSQYEELKDFRTAFPKTIIAPLGQHSFSELTGSLGIPFVLQFDRGHTGSGTMTIESESAYTNLQQKFPRRVVRLSSFIKGTPVTVNACATRWGTFVGGLSKQLTGLPGCTNRPQATVGNDWALPHQFPARQHERIQTLTEQIGNFMFSKGFRGMFGLDFIIGDDTVYLIEVNARQTASVATHNRLLLKQQLLPLSALHLLEFLTPQAGEAHAIADALPLPPESLSDYRLTFNKQALLAPVSTQLFRRNTAEHIVKVSPQCQPGVYTITNNIVQFVRSGYNSADLQNENELLLWTNNDGRVIEPEQEVARLQSLSPLVTADNALTETTKLYLNYLEHYIE